MHDTQAPRWKRCTVLGLVVLLACEAEQASDAAAPAQAPAKQAEPTSEPAKQPQPAAAKAVDATPAPAKPAPVPSRYVPVAASDRHTCAIVRTEEAPDRVKCWGHNASGELGLGDRKPRTAANKGMGDALPFVELPGATSLLAVGVSSGRSCALESAGKLWCWGGDDGEGAPPAPAVVPLPSAVRSFALGQFHACAVIDTGALHCWGNPIDGALGSEGDQRIEPSPSMPAVNLGPDVRALDVTASASTTCARLDDGTVKCFGLGRYGGLGTDSTSTVGDRPGTMGAALAPVDLGSDTVAALSSGGLHTCAQTRTHQVRCWGGNNVGQLGLGHTEGPGDKPGQSSEPAKIGRVDLGAGTVAAIAAGGSHTCAIVERASDPPGLKCWGTGGLGLYPHGARGDAPGEMGDALPFVDLGSNVAPAFVAAGGHTCAVLVDPSAQDQSTGQLKCWGYDPDGATGIVRDRWDHEREGTMGDALPFVDLGKGVRVALKPG